MSLSDEIEKVAEEHDDPRRIASIVGAKYDGQSGLIEALIEEILDLKQTVIPAVKQELKSKLGSSKIKIRDAYSDNGPAPTRGEEADPFTVMYQPRKNGFRILMYQGDHESERELLIEQQKDDISITCCSDPGGDPDATVFLREDRTEFHGIKGTDAVGSTSDTKGFSNIRHHVHDDNRP